MRKKELKLRLKIMKISIQDFLLEIGYNPKHLSRYKDDEEIPNNFQYALMYIEERSSKNKLLSILEEHKEALPFLKKQKNSPIKTGDNCYFWNKNSQFLVWGQLEKVENNSYFPKGSKESFQFIEKSLHEFPKKFFIKFFSSKEEKITTKGLGHV